MAIREPTVDPLDLRYERMVRERERCFRALREHVGGHLPRPVIAAVCELSEALLRLGLTPDDELDVTTVGRRPG